MGAVTQARILGGAIGIAIVSTVINNYVRDPAQLPSLLPPEDLKAILISTAAIAELPSAELQMQVKMVFAHGFSLQWKAILGFIAAQVPAALLLLKVNPKAAQQVERLEETKLGSAAEDV